MMLKHLTRTLLLVCGFFLSLGAAACTCIRENVTLEQVFNRSDQVFIAAVADVSMITEQPVHNERATYHAMFDVQTVFKGEPENVDLAFSRIYHEEGHEEVRIVLDCQLSFSVSDQYLVLQSDGQGISTSVCSSHLRSLQSVVLAYIELLAGVKPEDSITDAYVDRNAEMDVGLFSDESSPATWMLQRPAGNYTYNDRNGIRHDLEEDARSFCQENSGLLVPVLKAGSKEMDAITGVDTLYFQCLSAAFTGQK